MNERIIIRRMNAGRTTGTEEFPVADNKELVAGREPACKIRFDADQDDLVSRRHAKITISPTDPTEASLTDLGSSNGTFLNRQRVFNTMRINPGDIVQLGPGGPEFQYDMEPKVAGSKPTRMADVPVTAGMAPTREASVPTTPAKIPGAAATGAVVASSGSTTVGKATVERMITHGKTQTRNQMLAAGFVILLIVLGVGGYLLTRPSKVVVNNVSVAAKSDGTLSPSAIAAKNTDAVVYIEVAWSLYDTKNDRPLSQVYLPNAHKVDGKLVAWVPGAGETLPLFIVLDGKPEPVLSTDDGGGAYVPISERASGSGFVVSSDGFILTNRHVASGWDTSYGGWSEHEDAAGLLLNGDKEMAIGARSFPSDWVPSHAKVIFEGNLDQSNFHPLLNAMGFAQQVQGKNNVLTVTFAGTRIRDAASVASKSDRADVALIKVDRPVSLAKVELNDNYTTVQGGQQVTVMGYPGISPQIVQIADSKDPFNQNAAAATVPTPTVSNGVIGQVLRNGANNNSEQQTISAMGDFYQLAINTTGHGNSGGPVFDDHGKVIGIFTAGKQQDGAAVTFALPIKYGLELTGQGASK